MNYQLIMLPNPILVSDEKIKEGDYYLTPSGNIVKAKGPCRFTKEWRKIIAGVPELPQLDLSLIADEIGYVDVENLAKVSCENSFSTALASGWWVEGFKACQSLNQKKYTEEDIMQAFAEGHAQFTDCGEFELEEKAERYVKSLSKPKVYNVEVEMMYKNGRGHGLIQTNIPNISNNTIKVTKII